jgi:hypothetical protein
VARATLLRVGLAGNDRDREAGSIAQTDGRAPAQPRTPRWHGHAAVAVLAIWVVAAFVFARARPPYDDELFSITLIEQTDWGHFFASLGRDVHPPWLALVDRGLFWVHPEIGLRIALRVLASGLALWLASGVLRDRLRIPRWAALLGGFHPIVLMYGASVRWYPILFLGQALRAWALWRRGPGQRARGWAFVGGAAVGAVAGYLDVLFCAVDGVALLASSSGKPARAGSRWVVAGAACAIVLAHGASFWLRRPGASVSFAWVPASLDWRPLVGWAGLGLFGEAFPRSALLAALVPVAAAGLVSAVVHAVRSDRAWGRWFVLTLVAWAIATQLGVSLPRYGLLVPCTACAAPCVLWSTGRAGARSAATLVWALTGFVLALTLRQRNFVKGDLNRMPTDVCEALVAIQPRLIVAPYQRTALELRRTCGLAHVVQVPLVQHYPDADEQLGDLVPRLRGAGETAVVFVPVTGSSLELTNERVEAVLRTTCTNSGQRDLAEDPLYAWKRAFRPTTPRWRIRLEEWTCP